MMSFLLQLLTIASHTTSGHDLERRSVLALSAVTLGGCATDERTAEPLLHSSNTLSTTPLRPSIYDAVSDGGNQITAVDVAQVDQRWRSEVIFATKENPETSSLMRQINISTMFCRAHGRRATA